MLTDDQEVWCERWPICVNSILRFCLSNNLPKMRQHFFMCEKERMPQSRVALWWSVLCLYGLLDVFGLTWRDHDLRVPLCNLNSASKIPYFRDQTPRLLFTAATIQGRPLIEGGVYLTQHKQGSEETDWSTVYAQRRSFVSALGRTVLS